MRYFKDIIMSMDSLHQDRIQTHHILRHFLKTLSMIHMPPKPIVSADSETIALFLCKK